MKRSVFAVAFAVLMLGAGTASACIATVNTSQPGDTRFIRWVLENRCGQNVSIFRSSDGAYMGWLAPMGQMIAPTYGWYWEYS